MAPPPGDAWSVNGPGEEVFSGVYSTPGPHEWICQWASYQPETRESIPSSLPS